jgi:hypothetical protein
MRWRPLVISLPLVFCVSQIVQPLSHAQAAAMDASEAATLLAKSQAIDVKCGVLAKDQSQTLRGFVAQAEVSLAEKASVATARKAITGGRAAGKTAVCDDAAKKLVNDVLAAATAATVAPIADNTTVTTPAVAVVEPTVTPLAPKPAPVALAVVAPAPKKPAIVAQPKQLKIKVATIAPVKPVKSPKAVKPAKGLNGYALVAEKYYVAVRCGTLSSSRINSLYQTVLVSHRQALSSNRPRDVRNMLKAAEAKAGAKSCI